MPTPGHNLKNLGSGKTEYKYDGADAKHLERFDNPFFDSTVNGDVKIIAPEFTSLCPITGQPDFATIKIEYSPNLFCVESKSLKLYLGSYRQYKGFHEAVIEKICRDLVNLMDPKHIRVVGEFSPRGGISFWPTAEWSS